MKKVNLHTHSIYSDGDDTPEQVVELAAKAGVELLVLTDHNTFEGYPRFEAACREHGVNYIKGVEIDCVQPDIGFHQELLAYFPNGGEECLTEVLHHKQQARRDRVLRAIERAGVHYGVELKMEEIEAMAVVEKGFVGMISNKLLYRYLLTKCDKLPDYPSVQCDPAWKTFWQREGSDSAYTLYELISLVRHNGGLPVLAHYGFHFGADPKLMHENEEEHLENLRYMKEIGLWGIELHPYRYHLQKDEINAIIKSWADLVGLQMTTGSDYHGGTQSCHKIFEWFGCEFEGFDKENRTNTLFFSYINKKGNSIGRYGVIRDGEILIKPTYTEAIGFDVFPYDEYDMTHIACVSKSRKWGAINSSAEQILPMEYDYISHYDGILYVSKDNRQGAFTISGEVIIPIIYDNINKFNKAGFATVCKDNKWGAIDKSNRVVIPIKYDTCNNSLSSDNRLEVKLEGVYGNVDIEGNENFHEADSAEYLESTLRNTKLRRFKIGRKYGCTNSDGREILPAIYQKVDISSSHKSIVVKLGNKYGCFDYKGKEIIPIIYDKIELQLLTEKHLIVKLNDKYGYFDIYGKQITPISYDWASQFREDRAMIQRLEENGDNWFYGFIDTSGREITPIFYDDVEHFCHGRAKIKRDGMWGFIDLDGKEVISPKYSSVKDFISDTTVAQNDDGLYGLISYNGEEITPFKYDYIYYRGESRGLSLVTGGMFYLGNEYGVVQKDEKLGLINKHGEEITPIMYDSISTVIDGLLTVQVGKKCGVIDRTGREIIAPKYNDIRLNSRGFIGIKYRGKWALVNKQGKHLTRFVIEDINNNLIQIAGKWFLTNELGTISDKVNGGSWSRYYEYFTYTKEWRKIK